MWPPDFHLAALLDAYVGPKPVVPGYVRDQMLDSAEHAELSEAIEDKLEGGGRTTGNYHRWLSHSGLDFENQGDALLEAIESGQVHRALFDLMLGQRVKTLQLIHYKEVRTARALVEGFLDDFEEETSREFSTSYVWWEGLTPLHPPHDPWVSPALRNHPFFLPVFESWIKDSEYLQVWLEDFTAKTPLVNNPEATADRVFSHTVAAEVLNWAKVGCLKGPSLSQHLTISSSVPG